MSPIIVLLLVGVPTVLSQSFNQTHLGFPEAWDGDKYRELYCPSKNIPKWLDGYFLCQLSASYGNSSAPEGEKLNHMIDAIGAVGSFHVSNGQVVFSAQYYPARPYKIWEFYDRNMSKASVPWAGWSDYNLTAMSRWEQVPANPDSARFHPNLDFWKVGNRIVAGTEAPYWVGYEFDVRTLQKFKLFPFKEENDIFSTPRHTMIPISMAIHERNDADGTIWGSFSAMNFEEQRFFQGIFTVDTNGVRRVVGLYDYGVWDTNACGSNDEYIGDKTLLPGYIHSITSTENFIILPITSLLINPCKFKEPPLNNVRSAIQKGGLWGMDFYDMVPMRFLIFNKKTLEFTTQKPLEVFPSMFVTHQLNAFEADDGNLVADMVVYDSHDPYVKYFYTDFLTKQLYPSTARVLRFTLDSKKQRVMYNYLVPQETIAADFPQFNHGYEQKAYQWGYLVQHPFASGNSIIKINVDEPAGSRNLEFRAEPTLVLHEPWFVQKPDTKKEDEGVLLVRGLDTAENKGVLIVIDAEKMTELGRAYVPISIPFGFHNRFFSKKDLGLPEGFQVGQSQYRPIEKKQGFATLPLRKVSTVPPTSSTASSTTTTTTTTTTPKPTTTTTTPRPTTTTSTTTTTTTPRPTTTSTTTSTTTTTTSTTTTTTPQPTTTTTSEKPVTMTTQTWTAPPTTTVKRTTPQTVPTTTPKIPRWWPLAGSGSTEQPWWQKVQTGANTLPPLFPVSKRVEEKVEKVSAKPNESDNKIPEQKPVIATGSMDEIYEQTLGALCSWLPKVFTSISNELCWKQGKTAAKWMAPLAQTYAERFRMGRANRKVSPNDTPNLQPSLKQMAFDEQQQAEPIRFG
ncbi:hypothetical protein CAEBREN_11287 [Caenorhabditis brenneri]|uniref:Uncharacterized protein n=1 Tax=Caenorhabditis brenneri TaxID=135651 RepID=G0MT29_CAEBE|nr:hypothetical protein CAEBREN_11287 [Caenorhabditis brenneri]